jgi:hypothetical protein
MGFGSAQPPFLAKGCRFYRGRNWSQLRKFLIKQKAFQDFKTLKGYYVKSSRSLVRSVSRTP